MNQICDALGEADESQMDAMMEELGVIQDTLTMHDFYTIDANSHENADFKTLSIVIPAVSVECWSR